MKNLSKQLNEQNIVIRLVDKTGRGDIVVEKLNDGAAFRVWIEMIDVTHEYWESTGIFTNLTDAMYDIAGTLKVNCESDFYS